jgi:hypothetical protein
MQSELPESETSLHDPVRALADRLYRVCGLQGALAYARQEHMAGVVDALLAIDAELPQAA